MAFKLSIEKESRTILTKIFINISSAFEFAHAWRKNRNIPIEQIIEIQKNKWATFIRLSFQEPLMIIIEQIEDL